MKTPTKPMTVAVSNTRYATFLSGCVLAAVVAGCSSAVDLGTGARADGPPPPVSFPECQAESYDFIGEGTLSALGLDVATPVPPPNPGRVAMIWVTHDLLPHDFGEPGGPVEMVRMLCFEFADGSGGSGWPVDPAWQPPGSAPIAGQSDDSSGVMPPALLLAVLIAVVVLGVSLVAFRSQAASRGATGNGEDRGGNNSA
jgi:hypothetical protein